MGFFEPGAQPGMLQRGGGGRGVLILDVNISGGAPQSQGEKRWSWTYYGYDPRAEEGAWAPQPPPGYAPASHPQATVSIQNIWQVSIRIKFSWLLTIPVDGVAAGWHYPDDELHCHPPHNYCWHMM